MVNNMGIINHLGITNKLLTCPKHGSYMGFRIEDSNGFATRWSTCPRCQAENLDPNHNLVTYNHEEAIRISLRERTEDASLPNIHLGSRFENYTVNNQSQLDAVQACKDLINGHIKNMVLLGTTGVGKTHLAVATIHEAIQKGLTARYIKESVLFGDMLVAKEKYIGGDRSLLKHLVDYDLLVLDEIGKRPLSEYQASILFELIDERWGGNKRTFFCGNITGSEFKEHFTDPMISRIQDHGHSLKLTGKDYRIGAKRKVS